jgi:hypothetical protein
MWEQEYNIGLTRREVVFAEEYLKNGNNVVAAALKVGLGKGTRGRRAHTKTKQEILRSAACAGYAIKKRPFVRQYIRKRQKDVEREVQAGFKEKYSKLWQVATLSTPDNAKSKDDIDGKTTVSAVSEMNKMTGDIAPEKRMNLNVNSDADIKKIKELQKKYLEKNKKDY